MPEAGALLATLALRQIAERYALAVDAGDGASFAALFTEDGELIAPRGHWRGHERLAIVPPMMRRLFTGTHHSVTGLVAEFSGAGARAQTTCVARHFYADPEGRAHCHEMAIRYEDLFRQEAEEWRLARRRLVLIGEAVFAAGQKPVLLPAHPQARKETHDSA